jgi:hypothetical protein
MGAMTDYLANKVRDHVLRNTSYTSPTTVYLALFTTAPTEAGGGTEVTGGSYARQAIAFNAGTLAGEAVQAAGETFTNMPSCTVVAVAVMDALTSGNMLDFASLPRQRVVPSGDSFTLDNGDFRVLFD